MDQDEFRRTYRDVNENHCVFEKSILTNQCRCSRAERFCIAEREGVHCASAAAQSRCQHWLDLLREQARFALRPDPKAPALPHGKAIKVQVGGLRGLAELLAGDGTTSPEIADVHALLTQAVARFGSLDQVPFDRIMPSIAAYQGRTRRRRRERPDSPK